jgi:hypothetical protein
MSDWIETTTNETEQWNKTDEIIGQLIKKQSGIGANESNLYTLRTKDGDVAVWGSTVLDTKFQDIEVGYDVKIEPLGKVKSPKTGREYFDYTVSYRIGELKEVEPNKVVGGKEKAREIADSLRNKKDVVVEDIGDEPINLDDIPF